MKEIGLEDWASFEAHITELEEFRKSKITDENTYVSEIYYRGQSDAGWKLKTTLERYLGEESLVSSYLRKCDSVKPAMESLTGHTFESYSNEIRQKCAQNFDHVAISIIHSDEYMVYLRQYGFPSPLLDWSASPYIAAFFAVNDNPIKDTDFSIYAYIGDIGEGKCGWTAEPTIQTINPSGKAHKRHFLQQCRYTICTRVEWVKYKDLNLPDKSIVYYSSHEKAMSRNDKDQDLIWKFILPSSEKKHFRRKLDSFNINANSLLGTEESLMTTFAFRMFYSSDND